MKFTDLKCCPFCGYDTFYQKQYAYGTILFRGRFDGKEAHNEDLYEGLNYKYNVGRAYCLNCNEYLGNIEENVVGKNAQKALNKQKNVENKTNNT